VSFPLAACGFVAERAGEVGQAIEIVHRPQFINVGQKCLNALSFRREAFETHLAEVAARFDDRDVPRPPRWSGFRIVPRTVEFWYGGAYRLHERYLHEASDDGTWSTRMLQP